jgi:hypothetical protein
MSALLIVGIFKSAEGSSVPDSALNHWLVGNNDFIDRKSVV